MCLVACGRALESQSRGHTAETAPQMSVGRLMTLCWCASRQAASPDVSCMVVR